MRIVVLAIRRLDWVDWLAGVDDLGPGILGDDYEPGGRWLLWPWWRRLIDWVLTLAWVPWCLVITFWYAVRHWPRLRGTEEDEYYPDVREYFGIRAAEHDIDLYWEHR